MESGNIIVMASLGQLILQFPQCVHSSGYDTYGMRLSPSHAKQSAGQSYMHGACLQCLHFSDSILIGSMTMNLLYLHILLVSIFGLPPSCH